MSSNVTESLGLNPNDNKKNLNFPTLSLGGGEKKSSRLRSRSNSAPKNILEIEMEEKVIVCSLACAFLAGGVPV